MDKLKLSPAEELKGVEIQTIEQEQLDRVFNYLCTRDSTKPEDHKDKIGPMDVARTLQFLGLKPSKSEVDLIIWEVDDDLDGYVNKQEFQTMYKRCISDDLNLEPRKLYNLVQFLMYDKTFRGTVTVEETLQILFVRHGRKNLDAEIKHIFGEHEKNTDGSEREITYGEYVQKIFARALKHTSYLENKRANRLTAEQKTWNENEL